MTDGQSASLCWCQASSGAQDQNFVIIRQLRVCSCGAPSLTRRQVCRLQLLLALASAQFRVRVTLRLAVYRQSVCLGAKPLQAQDQTLFLQTEWS
jgi:hypothetical protein